jgi:hypothetical protein
VNKTKSLIENYSVLSNGKGKQSVGDDTTRNKLLSDIRTSLKSINWDIQDLDETISKKIKLFKFVLFDYSISPLFEMSA